MALQAPQTSGFAAYVNSGLQVRGYLDTVATVFPHTISAGGIKTSFTASQFCNVHSAASLVGATPGGAISAHNAALPLLRNGSIGHSVGPPFSNLNALNKWFGIYGIYVSDHTFITPTYSIYGGNGISDSSAAWTPAVDGHSTAGAVQVMDCRVGLVLGYFGDPPSEIEIEVDSVEYYASGGAVTIWTGASYGSIGPIVAQWPVGIPVGPQPVDPETWNRFLMIGFAGGEITDDIFPALPPLGFRDGVYQYIECMKVRALYLIP